MGNNSPGHVRMQLFSFQQEALIPIINNLLLADYKIAALPCLILILKERWSLDKADINAAEKNIQSFI